MANKDGENVLLYTSFVTLSYPFWDMLLAGALTVSAAHRTCALSLSADLKKTTAILFQIWADIGYAYALCNWHALHRHDLYRPVLVYRIFSVWPRGPLSNTPHSAHRAYSEQTLPDQVAVNNREREPFRHGKRLQRRNVLLQSTLIYLPLAVLLRSTIYSAVSDNSLHSDRTFFMVILTAIVGILVAVRYLITTLENEVLLREREKSRQEAEHRDPGDRASKILELDELLEHIVKIATSDLGFYVWILILIDKDVHPLYAQSRLIIHAATSSSSESITWRL